MRSGSVQIEKSRHCERSEAIHFAASRKMDCFVAEFIIGPAKGRTRWLLAITRSKQQD
jgi:hypothetical protein